MGALAHSCNESGVGQSLSSHLRNVAGASAASAQSFGGADLAHWVGLWHDLGKFHPEFQAYLANPAAPHGPDHKGAGAVLASRHLEPLVFLIAGHHGGLPNKGDLKRWLQEKISLPRTREALQIALAEMGSLEPIKPLAVPNWVHSEAELEFFLRLLFSVLVDADFLDTEKHFASTIATVRGTTVTPAELWPRFEKSQSELTGKRDDPVNRVRDEVYRSCLRVAVQPQGFFRLTVPTGGGKTRSSLAFALRHALTHELDRVIVAIPYTSIIEQTAAVYREALGSDAVLEHHSALTQSESRENPTAQELWVRLAAENWDAPIVVTTTVQLFESLFASRTSRCRKLHNIARSVVILDEVQMLPTHLLDAILDGLRQLVAHYGVSVVLCTATQPALDDGPYLKGLPDAREIAPEPERLFRELKRVRYEWPGAGQKMTWQQVAGEMQDADQALAIVNTKADAMALLDALDDPRARHLSTLMCGAHRRETLTQVREALRHGEPCQLVSTQVVEAGVDLDFPLVLRALGPLDRIVQAAGRCNRAGRLAELGRVLVFEPEAGKLPLGAYRTGAKISSSLLLSPEFDFDDPEAYHCYFRLLYQAVETDAEKIQEFRRGFNYAEVSKRFRMIDDDTVSVIVRPPGDSHGERVDRLVARLRCLNLAEGRSLLRSLQPYLVNVRARTLPLLANQGLAQELIPGVWEWMGRYDPVRGLVVQGQDPEKLVI